MDATTLNRKYLSEGTVGFTVIRKFFSRYSDALKHSGFVQLDDVVHEVFLSLSKTDFSKIDKVEHYVMRAIKLQCWSLLDKALRQKDRGNPGTGGFDEKEIVDPTEPDGGSSTLDGLELLMQVGLFKAGLAPREIRLLNMLIDETERTQMAENLGMNLNTLDTNIRRLRMRLAGHLKSMGYSYGILDRFS